MGNGTSSLENDNYLDEFTKFDGIETLGYRVLGVQPNSPASDAGLVSFLDFLVGCNGEMLMGSGEGLEEGDEYDDIDFPVLLKNSVGKELELLVHNIKSNTQRLVKITPSTTWGGAGLLGVTIRLDSYGGAEDRLIRVLSVEHNSPAAIAGLVPMKDYLLGTTSASFDSDEILAEVLMVHADRIVELYVYSSESDVVRVVTLMPTFSWGGKGLLGAEVGTGYLHRFPKSCRDTDGQSVERKVRMGVRPTEKVNALEKNEKKDDQSSYVTGEDEMVDSSHIVDMTDSMSGKAMCFAEQLEMEPEPTSEQIEKSKQSSCEYETNSTQNGHSTGSPPKLSPSPTAQEAKAVFDAPPPNQSPLPPPPYAAEVDLR